MLFDLSRIESWDAVVLVDHAKSFPIKVSFRHEPEADLVEGFRSLKDNRVTVEIEDDLTWILSSPFYPVDALAETIAVQLESESIEVKRLSQTALGIMQKFSFTE